MAKISWIMGCYNKMAYVSMAIYCIQQQTEKDWELVIVDDCSTDYSIDVLEFHAKNDKRIKLLRNDKNMGISYTYNRATRETTAPIILVAAADDVYTIGRAKWTLDYFKKHPDKDVVYFPFFKGGFDLKPFELKKAIPFDLELLKKPNGQFIGHGFSAYKREVGLKVPYREELKHGCDHAFFLDVAKAGFKFGWDDKEKTIIDENGKKTKTPVHIAGTYRFTPKMVSIQFREDIVKQDVELQKEYTNVEVK